eukprot:249592_1
MYCLLTLLTRKCWISDKLHHDLRNKFDIIYIIYVLTNIGQKRYCMYYMIKMKLFQGSYTTRTIWKEMNAISAITSSPLNKRRSIHIDENIKYAFKLLQPPSNHYKSVFLKHSTRPRHISL